MEHRLSVALNDGFNMRFYASLDGEPRPPFAYPHHIENEIEFFILVEGDVSFVVESRVYKMSRGDIIITKPNEMHHCIRNTNTVNHHYCFHFYSADNSLLEAFTEHNYGCDNLVSPTAEDREEILSLAERITRIFEENGDELEKMTLTLQMLSAVKRNLGLSPKSERLPPVLESILTLIDERLCEIESFDEICEELFISRSTLGRLFTKHMATTPRMYLEGKRLTVARRMLDAGESVSETCRTVGFTSTSSFIRLFKRRFGETPLKYKQK